MFSGLLNRLRRNIGVKLGLWYAVIFALSSAALFMLAYYLLAAALGSKDREVLVAQLKEAATVYESGGLSALRSWVEDQPPQVRNSMLVRIENRFTHLGLLVKPPP